MTSVPSELPRTPHSAGTDLSQNQPPLPSLLSAELCTSRLLSPSIPLSSQSVPRLFHPLSTERLSTIFSIRADDVLFPGDIVGEGIPLQAETLRLVLNPSIEKAPVADYQECAREFEVVRKLGTGGYAVVYLVREILFHFLRSEDRDDHMYQAGHHPSRGYGHEYAIKLLSKAHLDEEGLTARLVEATIHQAIPMHPNIVTLHRTMETSAFLVLLFEYVPGQDLLYFLEQARHHYKDDSDTAADPALTPTSPTPALLSSIRPSQLLSRTRLQLIASMFAQMCEAVAACHDASVFHRDIKPENFILTDGWVLNQDDTRERKVIVKLSDFGLSARDAVSSEMDCGSAPYMSYECRNNLAPVYKPRGADVWSLGIVLVNMLYHCNPWVDTVKGGFSAFDEYLSNPASFFMRRFTGMTRPVATFLIENVFCILDDP
ncbi:kinase-like domain-containing protein, partial [Russula dissimulans]